SVGGPWRPRALTAERSVFARVTCDDRRFTRRLHDGVCCGYLHRLSPPAEEAGTCSPEAPTVGATTSLSRGGWLQTFAQHATCAVQSTHHRSHRDVQSVRSVLV